MGSQDLQEGVSSYTLMLRAGLLGKNSITWSEMSDAWPRMQPVAQCLLITDCLTSH